MNEIDSSTNNNEFDEAFDDSSSSSGVLEPLTMEETRRISELEEFDIARHRHLQRRLIASSLGGAVPNSALLSPIITSGSSESEEEEINERRKRSRVANARRKRRKQS